MCVCVCGVLAGRCDELRYGIVYINDCRTLSFTMTNHSESALRFCWDDEPAVLALSPRRGHVLPGRSKDVTASLLVDRPLTLAQREIKCRVVRIDYDQPATELVDWDDRLKTVKWISAAVTPTPADTA